MFRCSSTQTGSRSAGRYVGRHSQASTLTPAIVAASLAMLAQSAFGHAGFTGYAGSPASSGSCAASCHGPANSFVPEAQGWPDEAAPGTTYTITIYQAGNTINNFNACVLRASDNAPAGTLTGGADTQTYAHGGEGTGVHGSSNNRVSYTFNWTAPSSGDGTVRLHVAVHRAPSASSPNGFGSFTASMAPSVVRLGGTVVTDEGGALAGATVTLTGDANDQVVTGLGGSYVFENLPLGGTFTVTPSYSNSAGEWTFSPQTRTVTNVQSDHWGLDFTGFPPRYTLGGTITADGQPLPGVTVVLTGYQSGQTITGSDGGYQFGGLRGGEGYTVTPSHTPPEGWWTFTPESRTVANLQGDQWGLDFSGVPPHYTIGGAITSGSQPLPGVTVVLAGYQSGQTTTGSDGRFQFGNLRGGESYTLTPSYNPAEGSWTFTPESRTVGFLDGDQWNQDFAGSPPRYSISGTVRNDAGNGFGGVRLVLSGDGADTAYSGTFGTYSFASLVGGGTYVVTPSYSAAEGAWTFDPPSVQFAPLNGSETGVDFTALRPRYSIAGSVTMRDGTGLPDVRIRLEGGTSSDSTLTDPAGTYSFADVPGGFGYAIVPSLAYDDSVQWAFLPETIEITDLVGAMAGQDFAAQLPVILSVGDGLGQPGSAGNPVDISLDNQTYNPVSLDSVSFLLTYASSFGAHVPPAGGVEAAGRAEGFMVTYIVDEADAASCSLFVSLTGPLPLVPGTGAICTVLFSVDQGADTTFATMLSFGAASAWDSTGFWVPVDHHDLGRFGLGLSAPVEPGVTRLRLHPPVPNPAAGQVAISFELPRPSRSVLVIRDLTGRVVATLDQGTLAEGSHTASWSGTADGGRPVPNGTFHCQLVACGQTASRLVVLVK